MKRRLRKEIEIALEIITIVLAMLLASVNEISVLTITMIIALIVININIIRKWGNHSA